VSYRTETPPSGFDLLEFARRVEQDGITSDILPAYIQAILAARLVEPDYLCRRAAYRLATQVPPLSPQDLAVALCALSAEHRLTGDQPPAPQSPASHTLSQTLRNLLARIRRLAAPRAD